MSASGKKKTICLNMIVKNEAHIIADTLEHLDKFIKFDYWVISDTGSTDATKEIIIDFYRRRIFLENLLSMPGKISDIIVPRHLLRHIRRQITSLYGMLTMKSRVISLCPKI